MLCYLNLDKIINVNSALKYDDVMNMSFNELLKLQQKFDDEKQKKEERDEYHHKIYKKLYLLFDELSKYVPEEVIFQALDTIPTEYIYSTVVSVPQARLEHYSTYYIENKHEVAGLNGTHYDILVPYYDQSSRCTQRIFKWIASYYYPLLKLFENDFNFYSIEHIYDNFSISLKDDSMFTFYLKLSLMDILTGDISNIINANVSDLKDNATDEEKEEYREKFSRIYNCKSFRFFVDILKNGKRCDL